MNSTSLAIIQADELDTIQRTGRLLAASSYFDGKGDNAQAIAMMATKILAGREMGFGPFASVNGIHIIKGKPSIGANLMAAAVKGSSRYDYRVREMSNDRCSIEFFEREGDKKVSLGISDFTKEDAVAAETQNMSKFPRNMLFARALSNGVRWYCPDVFSGNVVYVPEELGADVDSDGNVIEATGRVVRDVDTTTGEITPQQPATAPTSDANPFVDVEFERPRATPAQIEEIEALGKKVYGAEYNGTKLAEWKSGGARHSIETLFEMEAATLIKALRKKISDDVAQSEAVAA